MRHQAFAAALGAFLAGLFSPAIAGTLSTSGLVQIQQFGPPPSLGNVTPCNQAGNCSGSFQLLPPLGTTSSGETLFYNTNAISDYGILRASAVAQTSPVTGTFPFPPIAPYNVFGSIRVTGAATFRDQWTVTGGTAGTAGTMQLLFNMTGVFSSMAGSNAQVEFQSLDGPTNSLIVTTGGVGSSQLMGLTIPIVFGTPKDFAVQMQAWVNIMPTGPGYAFPGGVSGSANAMNTGVLTSVVVHDENGAVIPWQLSTASGSANFANLGQSSSTPEPATVGVVGLGLAGLVLLARRA